MSKRIFYFALVVAVLNGIVSNVCAQRQADSLLNVWLDTAATYELRAEAALNLAYYELAFTDPDAALVLLQKLKALHQEQKNMSGLMLAIAAEADVLSDVGRLSEAEELLASAVAMCVEQQLDTLQLKAETHMAFMITRQGRYTEAIVIYERMLPLADRLGLSERMGTIYLDLGEIHGSLGEIDEAIRTHEQARVLFDSLLAASPQNGFFQTNLSHAHAALGRWWQHNKQLDKALVHYNKAMEIALAGDHRHEFYLTVINMAEAYIAFDRLEQADSLLSLHADDVLASGNTNVASGICYLLADIAVARQQADKAVHYAEKAQTLLGTSSGLSHQQIIQETLAKAYRLAGDFENALESQVKLSELNDSLRKIDIRDRIAGLETKHEYAQKAQVDSIRNAEAAKVQAAELANSKLKQNIWLGGFTMVAILALIVFNRFRITRKQKNFIESQAAQLEAKNKIIAADFQNLKQFTENAAHELQTPMAIIQSKTELLLQHPNLDERQVDHINAIYASSNRLSRLNRSLLLLSRIENGQFPLDQQVDFSTLVRTQVDWVSEIAESQGLSLDVVIEDQVNHPSHAMLAETLVSNLLKNAIRHNVDNGQISISLSADLLEISNSGKPLNVKPESLFERFAKDSVESSGSGLGLAIVRQVCDANSWGVNYIYNNKRHTFRVNFAAA